MKKSELKEAYETLLESMEFQIPEEESICQNLTFSAEFEGKRIWEYDKILDHAGKMRISKAVVFIWIIVLAAFSGITAYAIFRLNQDRNEKNTDITGMAPLTIIAEVYQPDYLPEGYVLEESYRAEDFVRTVYRHYDGQEIYFSQFLYNDSSMQTYDNEESEEEHFLIYSSEAIYLNKNNEFSLIFYYQGYLFYMDSMDFQISKKDIIHMAESLQKKEE